MAAHCWLTGCFWHCVLLAVCCLLAGCFRNQPCLGTPVRLQVSLQRQMEKSSRDFTEWKRQRDRELLQLRKQGRLNAAQLQKVEALHSKQQAVLRRKMGACRRGLRKGQGGLPLNCKGCCCCMASCCLCCDALHRA